MSIKKLKPFITAVGVMLLLAAVTMGYFSAQRLSSIIPASGYEDKGVYSFVPVRVLPVQVENTGATGRARRMNPTKTVYMSTTVIPAEKAISGNSKRLPMKRDKKS